ncbi:MAG TPA: thermonuclease family protein [Chloroflexota bacterium]|nr:thermonuclease family protein [Chloroflexota bacterium]
MNLLYHYRIWIERVIDGDSIQVNLDQGLRIYRNERLRLLGVDTPELRAPDPAVRLAAIAAKDYTAAWALDHAKHASEETGTTAEWPFIVRTVKADSFGRWLGDVTCGQNHNLSADLLRSGNAAPY